MKTVEFEAAVSASGQIIIPPEVAGQIPSGVPVHIVILWEKSSLDTEWRDAGRRRFEAAYVPEDSVYEQLIDDAPAR